MSALACAADLILDVGSCLLLTRSELLTVRFLSFERPLQFIARFKEACKAVVKAYPAVADHIEFNNEGGTLTRASPVVPRRMRKVYGK